jgi:hypothetical protein
MAGAKTEKDGQPLAILKRSSGASLANVEPLATMFDSRSTITRRSKEMQVRSRIKRALRLAKAAATDPRLPKPVRWLFVTGLAAKALPVDFGLDELLLGTGLVLLLTRYRGVWREICAEID